MARRTVIWMAAAFLAVLIVPVAPAAAGGGCHQGVTQGDGDTVEMVDACFTPTILTVDPGETVTFVNTDPMTHNVTANVWGYFEEHERGRRVHRDVRPAGYLPVRVRLPPGDDRSDRRRERHRRRERGDRVRRLGRPATGVARGEGQDGDAELGQRSDRDRVDRGRGRSASRIGLGIGFVLNKRARA